MPAVRTIVFFGTPEFAVPTLAALERAGRLPARVVTQPARPVGRGRQVQDSAVARWALERGLEVARPERVREDAFLTEMRALAPDLAVVVAFGQIFPSELLSLPAQGCVNLHASLLPRFRGAAPIQAAIAAGETVTGVTTMRMEAGLDSGPILLQREMAIDRAETAGELSRRLAEVGGDLMVETVEQLECGRLAPRAQRHELATYAPRLTRRSGEVDWSLPAGALADRLRAYTPWPGLHAVLRGGAVKIVVGEALDGEPGDLAAGQMPGAFLGLYEGSLLVACGGGTAFGIASLQRPGKRPLLAGDFANGERLRAGERFE